MIRIGVVNIDVSHPQAFAEILNEGNRARYVAVFNDGFRSQDEVEEFYRKAQLEKICDSLEELADYVDVGFIQGCNWDKHLDYAEAFIKRNKPVFIDKPMVGNLADCERLLELEKMGATILGSSSVRYCEEVRNFVTMPEEEKGKVLNVSITVGTDEFNYAIHAVEGMCAMVGAKPLSTQYVGRAHQENQTCDTYFVRFKNGATAQYHCIEGKGAPFHVVALATKNTQIFSIDRKKLYAALLDQICNRLEGAEHCMANMEELTDSIKVMIAGKASKQCGGKEISLESEFMKKIAFDGTEFEKMYAAKVRGK